MYKAKEGFKGYRIRGMTEYQEAERDSGIIEESSESEFGAGVTEDRSSKRIRQAVFKCT